LFFYVFVSRRLYIFLAVELHKRTPVFYVIGEGGGLVRDSLLATEANLRESPRLRPPEMADGEDAAAGRRHGGIPQEDAQL
jgi:hypothetical protein